MPLALNEVRLRLTNHQSEQFSKLGHWPKQAALLGCICFEHQLIPQVQTPHEMMAEIQAAAAHVTVSCCEYHFLHLISRLSQTKAWGEHSCKCLVEAWYHLVQLHHCKRCLDFWMVFINHFRAQAHIIQCLRSYYCLYQQVEKHPEMLKLSLLKAGLRPYHQGGGGVPLPCSVQGCTSKTLLGCRQERNTYDSMQNTGFRRSRRTSTLL